MGRLTLFTALLLAPAGNAARAQDSVATLPQAIAALHPRQRVRLETLGGERFFGRYLAGGADTITLSSPLAPGWRTVHVDTLTRIWVQEGTRAWRGAAIAAGIGAILGPFLAHDFCALGEGPRDCGSPSLLLRGAFGGAILAAPLGLIAGVLFPAWRPLYPTSE
jgi:hypothetical protein